MPGDCPLEISHGVLPLESGRLLAPAATLPAKDRLGEQVLVAISDDGGQTWPQHAVVFEDPDKKFGYFEQKLAAISPDLLMAVCWTVTLGDVVDQPDSFVLSRDNGSTWGPARSTGIQGQTMTPITLGSDRLLVLYNRRYGDQGIIMNLVDLCGRVLDPSLRRPDVRRQGKARTAGRPGNRGGGIVLLYVRLPHGDQAAGRDLSGDPLVQGRSHLRHPLDQTADRLV